MRAGGVTILDYPSVAVRSLSTTFAWYAGYGRIGFDSQLWGFEEWKQFLNIASDYKLNQLNMCMYGYWPFEFPEYPDTCLRNIPMKVWNPESRNWVPDPVHPPQPGRGVPVAGSSSYAHTLSIRIFAYIGLNSYNGGFSNIHRDKRMKLPPASRYVNDFDSLCLSDPDNIEYLKKAMRRIVQLGLDGIVFEESEEAYWFCNCDSCHRQYGEKTASPAEAKHEANYLLLKTLHEVIKQEKPSCEVGLRAWREPPLEKSKEYLRHCRDSIPKDVCLYWAPGLYVPESEFAKWVKVFGARAHLRPGHRVQRLVGHARAPDPHLQEQRAARGRGGGRPVHREGHRAAPRFGEAQGARHQRLPVRVVRLLPAPGGPRQLRLGLADERRTSSTSGRCAGSSGSRRRATSSTC